ncbi:HAD-IIA family hydrolase [Rhodococcus sp. X156]|uniref:HAD-IIA family hydrolase n=1 Tax=Rhodococcus sp. X156 TaxID=2499145 RepID=UPI000FDB445F|nr:HAD-IIA family hydrolase [Rhodococcus sp. X156]
MSTLRSGFDALLVDLDGTVYAGPTAIPGAVDALSKSEQRVLYVTNNASRAPGDVAEHLRELGLPAEDADVVTSAQASAGLLAEQLPAGAAVLVVGTEALAAEIRERGLVPVRELAAGPAAVVQGHSPETAWPILAEAALAIRGGAVWVAANLDPTLPSDRGLLPGNGSMVAVLRSATDTEPQVAGKPAPPIMRDAVARARAQHPLVIGDRLDTDIAGGRAAELPTLLVMTGVSTALDVLRADATERPDYLAGDLSALDRPATDAAVGPVDGWAARLEGDSLVVACDDPDADPWDGLRAACPVAWQGGAVVTVTAEGAGAEAALRAWGVTTA